MPPNVPPIDLILLVVIWVLLVVVIYSALEYSTFRGGTRGVVAFCAATLGVIGGRQMLLQATVPSYVSMSITVLLGVAAIIVTGAKRVRRDARKRAEDDLDDR